jgi:cytosine/adenosine deaminase-related metal-dependent hydrolase
VTDRGWINAHTHIYSGLAPLGMPDPETAPENFVQILERVWWRLDRALDERSLRASARYYVAESLLLGTTTLIDHHESPDFIEGSLDVLADACDELGMRAFLGYGATERNDGRDEARRGLAECRRFLESNERPNVRGAVALHASFTVSDETIAEAGALCRELDAVMHVHLAEDRADVTDAQERGFAGPLQRLDELGALPPGSILAHGVWLEPDEVRIARDLGCWIVQNPRSNRGNGVGYPKALGESDRVALGTDGYPSDLAEEAGALRVEANAHGEDEATAMRRAEAAPGLVAERFGPDALAGDAVVRDGGSVQDVAIAGRPVVRDGALVDADLETIRAEAREEAPRLWERMLALAGDRR